MPGSEKSRPWSELDPAPVVVQQRRQAAADAQIDPGGVLLGVDTVHEGTLLLGHHLQRQLVVIAQEERPLAGLRERGRLRQDVDDREAVFLPQRHEQARHQGKVEGHVALVAGAKVGHRVLGPLIGFGQEHAAGIGCVDMAAQAPEQGVGVGQILAGGALALKQVGHRVEPQPVDTQAEPEVHHPPDRRAHAGVIEIQVGLVGVEAMPVVGVRLRVPGPVGGFEVLEDDARLLVAVGVIAPDVEVAPGTAGLGASRTLEPGVLVRGVVEHQFGDHPQAAVMRGLEERLEVAHGAVGGMDRGVVGDVVAVVLERRGIEG